MACTRNRIADYIASLGVDVSLGKTKARGNKGLFKAGHDRYKIFVTKGLSEEETNRVLAHEFMHYVHFCYDRTLKKMDFIFPNYNNALLEELISLTVEDIPKENIAPLFNTKKELKNEINGLYLKLKNNYPEIKLSEPCKKIENKLRMSNFKYLLKHDHVKVLDGFTTKLYTIDKLEEYNLENDVANYIRLKSKQRSLKRISSKISRLNKYYNNPSELLARAFVLYLFEPVKTRKCAPLFYNSFKSALGTNKIPAITNFVNNFTFNKF